MNSGLSDANFITELCSDLEATYWSHLSEALLAAHLRKAGVHPTPSHGGGPDFLVVENGQRIWIEVICPTPIGIPPDWLKRDLNSVIDFPHEQILLRWTSAIKLKAEKLIGSSDGKVKGYIDKGVVALDDAYVIAVNGRQLRGLFPVLKGISGFPFAMEAVFAVGPRQISFSREKPKPIESGHQHRPLILRPKKAPVPAYTFLDDKSKPISAIWAVDLEGTSALGNIEPMAVIHNPNAVTRGTIMCTCFTSCASLARITLPPRMSAFMSASKPTACRRPLHSGAAFRATRSHHFRCVIRRSELSS